MLGKKIAPHTDDASIILGTLMKQNNVQMLYITCTTVPGMEMPLIPNTPRVYIKPWADRDNLRWTYIYCTKHLDPEKLTLNALNDTYFFTRNIYVTVRGVLHYNRRPVIDPAMDDKEYKNETVPLWPQWKTSPRWLCEPELYTTVHLTPSDDLIETNYLNPLYGQYARDSDIAHILPKTENTMSLFSNVYDYAQDCADRFRMARTTVKTHVLKEQDKIRSKGRILKHFEIGDLVWVSIPLKTDSRTASKIALPKKFKFRWSGPMRIIGSSIDKNRFTLVETFPDGSVISRQANASRLRPYTLRTPIDSAEKAAVNAQDNFEEEIKRWESARIHKRRPKYRFAVGTHPELLRRYDTDYIDYKFEEKDFLVEMLVDFDYDPKTLLYSYHVKWLGFGPHYNQWLDEDDIPKHFVVEFWEMMRTRNSKAYAARVKWMGLKTQPQRAKRTNPKKPSNKSKDDDPDSPGFVVEIPLYEDSDDD